MIDGASGQFLDSPDVKAHAQYVDHVEQAGPVLYPVLKGEQA